MPKLKENEGLQEALKRIREATRMNSTEISLAGLGLARVPDSLRQLLQLQSLDLSGNRLVTVPEFLAQLPNLRTLFLHGNPEIGIPEEFLGPTTEQLREGATRRSPQEILAYLCDDLRPLNEAKLIMVGQGKVGKTSLVNMMVTGKFRKREDPTEGIKITDWKCPVTNGQVSLHIWDFGGQELMHATHRFFFTRRSVYCLVLNRRPGDIEFEADYWLGLIRAFGGKDAPVIVVLNKQKAEPFEVNQRGWLEKYSRNIKAFVKTDCEDKGTIARLKEAIAKELHTVPNLKALFPRRWFAIKDRLLKMRPEHISFEEYRKVCIKNGEANPDRQILLANLLHDLGIVLNYREDPRLRFNHVLRPEWVTEGIYALLHAFASSHGIFTHAQAARSLAKRRYTKGDTHFLLGLMERFELSFPLGDSKKRVLIPELLDENQPREAACFKPSECLNFGYKYAALPEGLLSRFIVRTHHLGRIDLRWKSGAILEHETNNCRALVSANFAGKEVRIYIEGPKASRPDLLAIIRNNFDVIHADYKLSPIAMVYPEGLPENPLNLEELEILKQNDHNHISIPRPDRGVTETPISDIVTPAQARLPQLTVFLSYSHGDEKYLEELRKHLIPAERNGLIRTWYDGKLMAGQKWNREILDQLERADIIICQISPDFLASDFCVLTELDRAIRRKERGEVELIAYILRLCAWKDEQKLAQFQMLPKGAKPLRAFRDRDRFWHNVTEGVKEVIKQLHARRAN